MNDKQRLTGLRTYIYECTECESGRFTRLVKYPERDEQVCEECSQPLTRRPSACTVNTRTSASFVDGTGRGDDWHKYKEAGKLEAESFDMPPEQRGEINKEIHTLKKVKK